MIKDMTGKMKMCRQCGRMLPFKSFHARSDSADGKHYICANCKVLNAIILNVENATISILDRMYVYQRGKCWFCGKGPQRKALSLDHDHISGEPRFFLCGTCNSALAGFGDSYEGVFNVTQRFFPTVYQRVTSCQPNALL